MSNNKLFLMFVLIIIIILYRQSIRQTDSLKYTPHLVGLTNGDLLFDKIIDKDLASILFTTFFRKTDQIPIMDKSTIEPVSNELREQ